MSPMQQMLLGYGGAGVEFPEGDSLFLMPGTWDWVCPPGIESVSVVCIGAGGGQGSASPQDADGGGGGALAYKNNISVTAGTIYTVTVGKGGAKGTGGGAGGNGGSSQFSGWGNTVSAGGGNGGSGSGGSGGNGGNPSGDYDGGGSGGKGGNYNPAQGGGGGAGGYSGSGGAGQSSYASGPGYAGSGGGGGGGNQACGGGVDLYGQGPNGPESRYNRSTYIGFGGSYGAHGRSNSSNDGMGYYGGGGGGTFAPHGAVRIIWAKTGETLRTFPNNTGDVVTGSTLFIGGQKHDLSSSEASGWGSGALNWNGMIARTNMNNIKPSTQTGAFTYEVWIKPLKLNDNTPTFSGSYGAAILGGRPYTGDGNEYGEWSLKPGSGGTSEYPEFATMTYHDDGVDQMSATDAVKMREWNHVVHTRDSSGNHKFYVNGVVQTLQNGSSSITWSGATNNYEWKTQDQRPIIAGWAYGGGHYVSSFHGFMSEMRVTNNQVYTSNFTPPTSRLSNISGTQWLILNDRYHPELAEVGPGVYDRPDSNVGTQRGFQFSSYTFRKGGKIATHINDHPYHQYEGDSGVFFGCMDYDPTIQRSYGYTLHLHNNQSNNPHYMPLMGVRDGSSTNPKASEDSPFTAGDEKLKPGYWSAEFDGTNGVLDYSGATSAYISDSHNLGMKGDFTLEMWIKTTDKTSDGSNDRRFFKWDGDTGASTNGNLQLRIEGGTGKVIMILNGGTEHKSTTDVCDGNWHHIAVSRYRDSSNNVYLCVDGVGQAAETYTGKMASGIYRPEFRIGGESNSSGRFIGKISNVRLLRHYAIYHKLVTEAPFQFTPPTKPLCRKKPSS
mgnify:CR=1 FL=1